MKDMLDFLKLLADETRLKIIMLLSRRDMCVCEIMAELGMSQPAVSHHLRILKKSGIVRDDKDGRWVFYSLHENVFTQRLAYIDHDLFGKIGKNIENRQTHRDYNACMRIEKEMNSCIKANNK